MFNLLCVCQYSKASRYKERLKFATVLKVIHDFVIDVSQNKGGLTNFLKASSM